MRKEEINPVYSDNTSLKQFIANLPDSFEQGGKLIWNGRNKIKAFNLGAEAENGQSQDLVVKKFKPLSLPQKLGYLVHSHKARRAYHNGMEMISRGLRTPMPVAYVELRQWGLIEDAYYICGTTNWECIEPQTDRDDWNCNLATALGIFMAEMHRKGVLHHDLNDTNTLYNIDEQGRYAFEMIDINRMKFYPSLADIPMWERIENMTRFTGRLDLYEFVVRAYAKEMKMEDAESFVQRAVKQKIRHDRNWYRRKRLTRMFKKKKK